MGVGRAETKLQNNNQLVQGELDETKRMMLLTNDPVLSRECY